MQLRIRLWELFKWRNGSQWIPLFWKRLYLAFFYLLFFYIYYISMKRTVTKLLCLEVWNPHTKLLLPILLTSLVFSNHHGSTRQSPLPLQSCNRSSSSFHPPSHLTHSLSPLSPALLLLPSWLRWPRWSLIPLLHGISPLLLSLTIHSLFFLILSSLSCNVSSHRSLLSSSRHYINPRLLNFNFKCIQTTFRSFTRRHQTLYIMYSWIKTALNDRKWQKTELLKWKKKSEYKKSQELI